MEARLNSPALKRIMGGRGSRSAGTKASCVSCMNLGAGQLLVYLAHLGLANIANRPCPGQPLTVHNLVGPLNIPKSSVPSLGLCKGKVLKATLSQEAGSSPCTTKCCMLPQLYLCDILLSSPQLFVCVYLRVMVSLTYFLRH